MSACLISHEWKERLVNPQAWDPAIEEASTQSHYLLICLLTRQVTLAGGCELFIHVEAYDIDEPGLANWIENCLSPT